MSNPQAEDGHVDIANEVMDALCRIRIPGEARQILDFIIRKTWGWKKKEDAIPLSQFEKGTGLKKTHVLKAVYKLQEMNLIITQKGNGIVRYGINKDYDSWKPLPKKVTEKVRVSTLKPFCYICGFEDAVERHHIIPRNEGGSNKISNIVSLCPNCHTLSHRGKYDRDMLFLKKVTVESITQKGNVIEENSKKPLPKTVPSKDTTKDTTKDKSIGTGAPVPCPHQEIIALYHEILPELNRVVEWTEGRQSFLRTRWKEKKERQSLDWWRGYFRLVSESDFLTGKAKGFKADLEWLVRPSNFIKVIEGRYKNNGVGPPNQPPAAESDADRRLRETREDYERRKNRALENTGGG